jgi:hypothetical protein
MTYQMKTIPKVKHRIMRSGYGNQNPCGVHVIGGCLPHASVKDCIFSGMSRPSLDALESISSLAAYPKNAILFVEGQDTRSPAFFTWLAQPGPEPQPVLYEVNCFSVPTAV